MLSRLVTFAALAAGGVYLSKRIKYNKNGSGHSFVQVETEVNVPVTTAYNQWTQFEEFPRFMNNVKEVRQLDDTHLHWRADMAFKEKEWDAEITQQIPDKRIAWRSTSGPHNAGEVSFHPISGSKTRIVLKMEYDPESFEEKVGDALGAVRLMAKGNLKRFKQMIEERGVETGAWRGKVDQH